LPHANLELNRLAEYIRWAAPDQRDQLRTAAAELEAQDYLRIVENDVYFITSALVCKYAHTKKA
jgi:predicted pyridoxine 5'-phosphate oxidase superfamily flavin-nucleotide-binding protein